MAAIDQIERDIAALAAATATIAEEIQSIYSSYLSALSQAVRQQLVVASYHLCTQTYPEAFLRLGFSQQQQLQQALQQLGQQAEPQLYNCLQLLVVSENAGSSVEQLTEARANLEQAITEALRQLSRQANQLLQRYGVLPPIPIEVTLEAAGKAEDSARSITGAPNLLSALVEIEAEESEPSAQPTHQRETAFKEPRSGDAVLAGVATGILITTIYLRLGEIEFADPTVTGWRSQIRKLCARLASLEQDVAKKQRERIIAQAEAAWRASWSNPES